MFVAHAGVMKKLSAFALTALLGAGLALAQAPAAGTPAQPSTTTKVKKHHKKHSKKTAPASTAATSSAASSNTAAPKK